MAEINDIKNYDEKLIFQTITKVVFRRCLVCNKFIDETDPHIIAYKNDIPAYFCREHIDDAKHYLDWYQEFVEASE